MQLKAQNEAAIRAEQAALAAKIYDTNTALILKGHEDTRSLEEKQQARQIANQSAAIQMKVAQIGLQKDLNANQNAVLLETIKANKEGRLTPDAFLKIATPLIPEIEAQIAQEESEQKIKLSPEERKKEVYKRLQGQVAPVMQAFELYKTQNSPPNGIVSIRPAP